MQSLEVSGAVRPIYGSLGVKRLTKNSTRTYTREDFSLNIQCSMLGYEEIAWYGK